MKTGDKLNKKSIFGDTDTLEIIGVCGTAILTKTTYPRERHEKPVVICGVSTEEEIKKDGWIK